MARSPGVLALLLMLAPAGPARADEPKPPAAPAPAAAAPKPSALAFLGWNAQGAEEWLREVDGATVIRVPGGKFLRRPYEGQEASKDPVAVEVRSFFVDKHEVTNERFARFLNARPHGSDDGRSRPPVVDAASPDLRLDPKSGWTPAPGRSQHPVTAATGAGALGYAEWAGARLPKASEWEKAASGTDGRLYPWGNEPPDATRANFGRPEPRGVVPVGSFAAGASPYGALDMAGNAYERVYGDGTRASLPVVIKGGSWLSHHPLNLRVLDLCMQPMEFAETSVGFRCVMDDPDPDRAPRPRPARPALRLATDFKGAVAEAQKRRVPVFLALLLDTCGQCDRTREQCFRDPKFIAYCNEHLVVAMGHQPGDAQLDPHPPGENDACPLYPGLTCTQHELLYARGLEVVGGFTVSPGCFLLHPDRIEKGAGAKALLVAEDRFPKWGADVAAYLAAFEEGRKTLAEAK